MKIKNVNGTFWNEDNECFGPVQAATEYGFVEHMPASVENNDGTTLEQVIYCTDCAMYYRAGDYDADALARAVE